METAERIALMEKAADAYAAVLEGASPAVLTRRPDGKNWAPVEIVCHMRDVEESFLSRFKTILEVKEYRFQASDADRWAEERQYLRNDALLALSAFRARRKDTVDFLKTLDSKQLSRTGIHPRLGPKTISELVELLVGHDANHLDQLKHAVAGKA